MVGESGTVFKNSLPPFVFSGGMGLTSPTSTPSYSVLELIKTSSLSSVRRVLMYFKVKFLVLINKLK